MFKDHYIFESYEYVECDFAYLLFNALAVPTRKPRLKVAYNCHQESVVERRKKSAIKIRANCPCNTVLRDTCYSNLNVTDVRWRNGRETRGNIKIEKSCSYFLKTDIITKLNNVFFFLQTFTN